MNKNKIQHKKTKMETKTSTTNNDSDTTMLNIRLVEDYAEKGDVNGVKNCVAFIKSDKFDIDNSTTDIKSLETLFPHFLEAFNKACVGGHLDCCNELLPFCTLISFLTDTLDTFYSTAISKAAQHKKIITMLEESQQDLSSTLKT